jgi:hypothetical protein
MKKTRFDNRVFSCPKGDSSHARYELTKLFLWRRGDALYLFPHPLPAYHLKHLSTDSKLLYGMLLDRMSLSIKNEWYNDTGRVYIYYTVDEICSSLNCGRDKAMKLLAELDTGKGVGLIERKKQGQGKPTRIYVKRFTTQEMPPQPEKKPEPPAPSPGVEFADVLKSDFPTSRGCKNPPQEVEETDPNQTKRNQLDFIQPDPSIYPPAPSRRQTGIDRYEVREEIKESIEYEHLRQELPYDDVESLLELIVDVLSSTASTM